MYNLLDYRQDGPILHFTFVVPGDDQEWHHSALASPLLYWFNDSLEPLVQKLGERLTAKDAQNFVCELAAKESIPLVGIDWLGLALIAVRAYADAVARLDAQSSPESEQNCSAVATLADKLCQISEEFMWAMDEKSQVPTTGAA